jgi:hypothetical protein
MIKYIGIKGFKVKKERFQEIVDYYADFFYRRCEFIKSKRSRILLLLNVCDTQTVMSEQIAYGLGVYLLDKLSTEEEYVKKAYKIIAAYIFIRAKFENVSGYSIKEEETQRTFAMRAGDIRYMKYFKELIEKDECQFTLEFVKYFCKQALGLATCDPLNIALSANILYNSYQRFLEDGAGFSRRKITA